MCGDCSGFRRRRPCCRARRGRARSARSSSCGDAALERNPLDLVVRSRLISSAIVALALCIGVSATTRSLPTMPTAMDGCCWMQRREAPRAARRCCGRPADGRRRRAGGADAGGKPPQQILVERDARPGASLDIVGSFEPLQFCARGRAHAARPRATRRREARRAPAGVPIRRSAAAAAARSAARAPRATSSRRAAAPPSAPRPRRGRRRCRARRRRSRTAADAFRRSRCRTR